MSKQAGRRGTMRSMGRRRRGPSPSPPTVQYTVRSVPTHVDEALRRKAHQERKSLNELASAYGRSPGELVAAAQAIVSDWQATDRPPKLEGVPKDAPPRGPPV